MADVFSLIQQMRNAGDFAALLTNPRAQFGAGDRTYLGASLLPERPVMENVYREDAVRYKTVIANSGTRYGPAQKKGGELVGDFLVELADSDIAREITGRDYDKLINMVGGGFQGFLSQWIDTTVNRALIELNEAQRWQAIVDASVVRTGDNGYTDTVAYSNPAGHRAAAASAWSNDSYDPFDDIYAMVDMLAGKGYTVNRIISSRPVLSKLAGNDKVKARTGVVRVSATGQIQSSYGRATADAINGALASDGLPPIELYDLQYRTQTSTNFFLKRDVFVMVCTTGRDEMLDMGDGEQIAVPNVLGYQGVGKPAGSMTPGRTLDIAAFTNKPPRVEVESWQTSLPVILEPEAIAVITSIT